MRLTSGQIQKLKKITKPMVCVTGSQKTHKMATSRFEHFTVNPHDPSLDWPSICKDLFVEGGKCLVVLENKKKNTLCPHVHVQGETTLAPSTFGDTLTRLITTKHYKRKYAGHENARVCKRVRKSVDGLGFQYISKHDDSVVLFSSGFSAEDLDTLKEASEDYVEQLKHSAEEFVWSHLTEGMAFDDIVAKARFAYYMWLEQEGKSITPDFRARVSTLLMRWPGATREFKFWHSQHI